MRAKDLVGKFIGTSAMKIFMEKRKERKVMAVGKELIVMPYKGLFPLQTLLLILGVTVE